jgi:hypothetical protein
MKKNEKDALVALMGAIGVIFLLAGIFTPLGFTWGLFIALVIWILTGVLKTYLRVGKK